MIVKVDLQVVLVDVNANKIFLASVRRGQDVDDGSWRCNFATQKGALEKSHITKLIRLLAAVALSGCRRRSLTAIDRFGRRHV